MSIGIKNLGNNLLILSKRRTHKGKNKNKLVENNTYTRAHMHVCANKHTHTHKCHLALLNKKL